MFNRSSRASFATAALAGRWNTEQVLPQVVDGTLGALIVLAPLVWGGRGDIARAVYAFLVAVATIAWLADTWITKRSTWRWTPAFWIPVAAIAWVIVQLLPLPEALVGWLSPRTVELLPLWQGDSILTSYGLGHWRTLSLNPSEGQISLAMLLSYTLLAVLLVDRLQSREKVDQLLRWMGIAAVLMAAFGVLQFFTAGGMFFWVYDHPFRRSNDFACGSFINRNHFASFLAMGAVAIACQLVRGTPKLATKQRNPQRSTGRTSDEYQAIVWACGLVVVALGMVLSASRGGTLAALAGVVVALLVYWRKKLLGGRQLGYGLVVVVVVSVLVALYGQERLVQRLEDLTSGSVQQIDRLGARRAIWSANVEAISDAWLTGSGAGTHLDIYPAYIDQSFETVFTHAENGYLQIATELGLPGIALLIAVLACTGRWTVLAWRRCETREQLACLGAVLAGLTISVVHNLVDFVWFIPATMTLTLACLFILRRLAVGDERNAAAGSLPYEFIVATGVAIIYIASILLPPAAASPAWHRYIAASAMQGLEVNHSINEYTKTGAAAPIDVQQASLLAMVAALRDAVDANPRSGAVHLRLARTYLQVFDVRTELRENRMNLGQIQGAVVSGGFDSQDQLEEWLGRAVGEDVQLLQAARRHAIEAVRHAPLQAFGYVCLANLSFLEDPSMADSQKLLDQAVKLSPRDGDLLFEVGKQHLLAGRLEPAIDCWTRAFQQRGQQQLLVVAALAGQMPADVFLETFKPDWTTLPVIWQQYLAAGNHEHLEQLLAYATEQSENYEPARGETPVAFVWGWLGQMNADVGNTQQQLECLERAVESNGTLLWVRKKYAIALYQSQQFAEAEPHLRWCLARDSADKDIRALLQSAAKQRHKQSTSAFLSARRAKTQQAEEPLR